MDLHELIYVSLATREMSTTDLSNLLDQARQKNSRLNITGLLVYYQQEFMQLLEGSKDDIFSLYDTICQDRRHTQYHLMWSGPIQQRSFSDWSMAFLLPEALSLEARPAYSSFLQHGLNAQAMNAPKTMGKSFLISLREDFLRK